MPPTAHVWYLGKSGKNMLGASLSHFDPIVWSGRASQEVSSIWFAVFLDLAARRHVP
jgi:hypothetical protein